MEFGRGLGLVEKVDRDLMWSCKVAGHPRATSTGHVHWSRPLARSKPNSVLRIGLGPAPLKGRAQAGEEEVAFYVALL